MKLTAQKDTSEVGTILMKITAVSPSGSVLTDPDPFYRPFCYFGSVLGLYFFKCFLENFVLNA